MGDLFYFGIRGADSQRWIRFPQTHCCIQIGASQPRFETRLKITLSCSLERQERYMTMKKNESNIVTRCYRYLHAARHVLAAYWTNLLSNLTFSFSSCSCGAAAGVVTGAGGATGFVTGAVVAAVTVTVAEAVVWLPEASVAE